MRIALWIFFLFLVSARAAAPIQLLASYAPVSGGGSIALVAHTGAGSTGNSGTTVTTSGINTTGATLITITFSDYSAQSRSTVSDTYTNTWTYLTSQPITGSARQTLAYCLNPTVGSGHTFTVQVGGGTNCFPAVCVSAWSGVATSSAFDQTNGFESATTSTSAQPGSVTPTTTNQLVISGVSLGTGATTSGSITDPGFAVTDGVTVSAGNHFGVAMGYLIQTTISAQNPTWTWSGSAARACSIASFKSQ